MAGDNGGSSGALAAAFILPQQQQQQQQVSSNTDKSGEISLVRLNRVIFSTKFFFDLFNREQRWGVNRRRNTNRFPASAEGKERVF